MSDERKMLKDIDQALDFKAAANEHRADCFTFVHSTRSSQITNTICRRIVDLPTVVQEMFSEVDR